MKCRRHGPFLAVRTMNPSVNFPKTEVERVGSNYLFGLAKVSNG